MIATVNVNVNANCKVLLTECGVNVLREVTITQGMELMERELDK